MKSLNGNLKAKRILVAGGGGYLGTVLVKQLLLAGFEVIVCDSFDFGRKVALNGFGKLQILACDICKIPKSCLSKVSAVVNLVALSNDAVCDMFPKKAWETNVRDAVNLAKAAKNAGALKYIFSSSCAVYGIGSSLTEESSPAPISLYARLKLEAENQLLKLANSDFSVTILRNATLFGLSPRMRFDLVVNTMTLSAFQKGLIKIDGAGQQFRPLTHVSDAASAFLLTLKTEPKVIQKQIFNIVSENKKVLEIAKIIAKIVPTTKLEVSGQLDGRSYYVSGDKAKLLLEFAPKVLLKDGVEEILTALKNGLSTNQTKVVDAYSEIFQFPRQQFR